MPRPGENSKLEELNMTKEELGRIKEAFEKEEFRKMFADYIDEINDPKNKAIYENEITQMEKERGVDITFVYPNPGYVMKTSVDGKQKAFINVCHNENVGKPYSSPARQGDSLGQDWSLPYLQASPRIDMDKSRNRCLVYDVVFHPETLRLAKTSTAFKKFVDDTALTAVEDNYKVKLDRKNVRFPKMTFKGAKHATVIRRKSHNAPELDQSELLEIPNYPYKPLKENPTPIVTKVESKSDSIEVYTTPTYIIKHRKGVDMHEFSNALDSKIHAATPTELLVIIDLPLVKSASDVTLDVYDKSLSLVSEAPAKYRLDISLPWSVDSDNGNAKFDKSTKKLHVTLPVRIRRFNVSDLVREDSGIESDHNPSIKSSSEEDISECAAVSDENKITEDDFRTSENAVPQNIKERPFLDPNLHYSFPPFTLNSLDDRLAVTLDVQNVDSSSVRHRMLDGNKGVQLCLTSVGSGFFPIHYAFCLEIPGLVLNPDSVETDISEDNLVLQVKILSGDGSYITRYLAGTAPQSLSEHIFPDPVVVTSLMKETKTKKQSISHVESVEKSDGCLVLALSNLNVSEGEPLTDEDDASDPNIDENIIPVQSSSVLVRSESPKEVETVKNPIPEPWMKEEPEKQCKLETEVIEVESQIKLVKNKIKAKKQLSPKNRTHSVSLTPSTEPGRRRSILKCSRSLSESNVDDYCAWSSVDSSDSCIPEEMANGIKKTVRFSDIITQKYFRANSSILGQRKKNQRKARNKKKAQERRASESEASASEGEMTGSEIEASDTSASDVSDVSSDTSEVEENLRPPEILPSSKKHRRRGQKNRRKNASTAKHNMVLHID